MHEIDSVWVLALDKRKNLIPKLEEQVNNLLGLPLNKFWVGDEEDPDIKYDWIDKDVYPTSEWSYGDGLTSIRHYRAHLSHKKIILKAMKAGNKNFLLLEDDAVFLPRTYDVLSKLSWIDFDLIYLGHHAWEYKNDKAIGANLEIEKSYEEEGKTSLFHISQLNRFNVGGFHGVIINNSAYNKLLNLPVKQPIDSLVNENYNSFNRFLVLPKVIADPCGWSYCDNREVLR